MRVKVRDTYIPEGFKIWNDSAASLSCCQFPGAYPMQFGRILACEPVFNSKINKKLLLAPKLPFQKTSILETPPFSCKPSFCIENTLSAHYRHYSYRQLRSYRCRKKNSLNEKNPKHLKKNLKLFIKKRNLLTKIPMTETTQEIHWSLRKRTPINT